MIAFFICFSQAGTLFSVIEKYMVAMEPTFKLSFHFGRGGFQIFKAILLYGIESDKYIIDDISGFNLIARLRNLFSSMNNPLINPLLSIQSKSDWRCIIKIWTVFHVFIALEVNFQSYFAKSIRPIRVYIEKVTTKKPPFLRWN